MDGAFTTTVVLGAAPFIPSVLTFVESVSWEHCLMFHLMTLIHLPLPVAKQQIRTTYGGRSGVMRRFNRAQRTEGDRHE